MRTTLALALSAGLSACATTPAPQESAGAPTITAPEFRITQEPVRGDFAFEGAFRQGGMVIGTAPQGATGVTLDGRALPLDPDRRFLMAFDRDARPTARIAATFADGGKVERVLNIVPGAWRVERVDAPLRPVRDSEAFMAIRKPELEAIAAARSVNTDAHGWRQRFYWPITGRVSGLFGAQRIYRGEPGAYHGGVDVAADTGAPVHAPADGVVVFAADKPFSLEGNLLLIDHGAGLNSAFLHLSRIDVKVGDHVARGQILGAVGATGRATGPHMHWGLTWNGVRLDPVLLTGPMPGGLHVSASARRTDCSETQAQQNECDSPSVPPER